jgi:hypothetical protein
MPFGPYGNSKKAILPIATYLLGVVSVGLLVVFGGEILKNLDNLKGTSILATDSVYGEAEVYVNEKRLGVTPFESRNISSGQNKITLKNSKVQYETTLNFLPGADDNVHIVGVFRDLGVSDAFSSGQEFWFEKDKTGNTMRVVSNPSGASVIIDGTEVGKTPFSSNSISEGEYDLIVSYPGFERQSARINTEKNYTLNASLKLFPLPVPETIQTLEGSTDIYNVSSDNASTVANTQEWAAAVIYWNSTRGVNLKDVGLNTDLVFDYLLDYKGNLFDSQGALIKDPTTLESVERGAYLNRISDKGIFTSEAKETFLEMGGSGASGGKLATIKVTETGWLRVRKTPSGTEVAKVDSGGKYLVLEEGTGWIKIKVSETIEGWVHGDYVTLE